MNRLVSAGVVIVGLVAVSAVFARAQSRGPNGDLSAVSIRHIDPDAISAPFPLLSSAGTIRAGAIHEIYFTNPIYVPALGRREKLFVLIESVTPDGWIHVQYGDEIKDKGATNAALVATPLPLEQVIPQTPVQWTLHYTAIAAMSPRLNAAGAEAQYWPE